MAYTPATKLPDIQIIELESQSFASSLNTTTTTVVFSKAILDYNGNVVTKEMIVKGLNKAGETENIYIPANGLSADGKTATGVVRGVRLDGLDYTTGDSNLAKEFDSGDKVVCPVSAVLHTILLNVLYGNVASGGNGLIIGDETSSTKTISRSDGTVLGWLRHNGTRVQFSDNGTDWISNSDSIASALVKVSATDTTEGYLESKIQAGSNVTLSTVSSGANEKLQITAESRREGIVDHETYTPAFYTGGTSAETNISLWDNVADGSFRITLDGTAYNVDGLDFTAGPVTTMTEVATVIQVAIRTLTGGDETVTWNTNRFIINSANTTVNSEVNTITTSTGTVGTDISGATWTDLASGSETSRVLDITADAGKVALLDTNGKMKITSLSGESSVTEDHVLAADATGHVKTIQLSGGNTLLENDNSGFDHTGTTTLTSVYSYTVPANTLGTGKVLRVTIPLSDIDVSSSNSYQLFFGGTYICDVSLTLSVSNQYGELQMTLAANGSTGSQKGWIRLLSSTGSNERILASGGTVSIDSTVDRDIELRIQHSHTGARSLGDFVLTELLQ